MGNGNNMQFGIPSIGQFLTKITETCQRVFPLSVMAVSVVAGVGGEVPAFAQAPLEWKSGQILVQPRTGLSEDKFNEILQRSNGKAKAKIGNMNIYVVDVPERAEQAVARALAKNKHVQFAEVDGLVGPSAIVPNDPVYPKQWHLPKIQAPIAWETTQGGGITVAVLDTGVEGDHPDLHSQMVAGRNVVSDNSDTSAIHSHGTAVAGTFGAVTNNGQAVAGVAGQVKIMPIRVTNRTDGSAYWSDVAKGLNWAADHGARVANISYGVTNSSTVTTAANYFRSKGGVVVVAAGNNSTDPGYSDNSSMISVSATIQSDELASFSNYGSFVDVAAPGYYIYSTRIGGTTAAHKGTSFASPVTAGVVALIMATNPNLSPTEVEAVLKNSADDLGNTLYYGAGRVNAAQAVQMAGGNSGGNDLEDPIVAITNPSRDSTVTGWVTVDVNATDNVRVTKVVLYAGSQEIGEDMSAPFQFDWDSTKETDGLTTLIAYAYDEAGNEGSSGSHPVEVNNIQDPVDTTPPTVSISQNPSSDSSLSGTVSVTVVASDDTSLSSVKLEIDGTLKASSNISPLTYSWDTTTGSDGSYLIKGLAVDGAGNASEVNEWVTVKNIQDPQDPVDTTPPTVSISAPANVGTVSGTVSVSVGATDDVGVTKVVLYAGTQKIGEDTTSPYQFSWDTTQVADGSVTLQAYAYDAANNEGRSDSWKVEVDNSGSESGDTIPPKVWFEPDLSGKTLSGNVGISVKASDNQNVATLVLYIDGKQVGSTSNSTKLRVGWQTKHASPGEHVISAMAQDSAGNITVESMTVIVAEGQKGGR